MIVDAFLNLVFPRKCILCQRILARNETDLCHSCRTDSPECLKDNRKFSYLDSWAAIWYYKGYIRSSILRFKFHRARQYAPVYGRLLAMRLLNCHEDGFDLITWVPVSRLRKLRRGYDQVELLAKYVGAELGMKPVRLLVKIRHNRAQSGIAGQAKRRANVLGAYRMVNPEQVRGKRILLLDDVITTGATAGECARVLLTAGAKEVHCGCIAAACHE